MGKKKGLWFSEDVIIYPLLFVSMLWLVFWVESRFNFNFNYLGIYPLKMEGLRGIVLGPFIHSNLQHIFNNSVPLFVLTTSLFYFYRGIRWRVLLGGLLLTGLMTWIIGRPAVHIGASGVVYMLVAFLFFKGILSKQYQLIALSLVVVFLYGSLVWYLFPIDPKISWEGHLSGFAVGLLFAFLFRRNPIENRKYAWEQEDYDPENDPFLKHFDENGNFIERIPDSEEPELLNTDDTNTTNIRVVYTFKKDSLPKDNDLL